MEHHPDILDQLDYNELNTSEVFDFLTFLMDIEISAEDLAKIALPDDLPSLVRVGLPRLITAFRLSMNDDVATKKTIIAIGKYFQDQEPPTNFTMPDTKEELLSQIEYLITALATSKVSLASATL